MENPNPITPDTKILCLDVEANGLHGPAFAVGAVLITAAGEVLDEFMARCPIEGPIDKWVKENVLPKVSDLPETHPDASSMRESFWEWFKATKENADYVLLDNGYPVESRFLITCQQDNLDERYWQHPFPLLELSSLLIQVGIKPLAVRYKLVEDQMVGTKVMQHNPRYDAEVSARAAILAFTLSGQLKEK